MTRPDLTWFDSNREPVAERITVTCSSVGEFLAASSFRIPKFQRIYKWREQQWAQTFDDLREHIEMQATRPMEYHMGDMRFEEHSDGTMEVADGQQRLLTLTTLIAALSYVSKVVRPEAPWNADKLLTAMVQSPHGVDRVPRITDQAEEWTLALASIVKSPDPASLKGSPIERAYCYFVSRIEQHVGENEALDVKVAKLKDLIDILVNRTVLSKAIFPSGLGQQAFSRVHTRGTAVTSQEVLKAALLAIAGNTPDAGEVWKHWRVAAEIFDTERRGLSMWATSKLATSDSVLRDNEACILVQEEARRLKDQGQGVHELVSSYAAFAKSWDNLRKGYRPEGGVVLPTARNISNFGPLKAQKQLFWLLPAGAHLSTKDYDSYARAVEDTIMVAAVSGPFPPDVERFVASLLRKVREVSSLESSSGREVIDDLKRFRDRYAQEFANRLVYGGQHELPGRTMEVVVRYLEAYAQGILNGQKQTEGQNLGEVPVVGTLEHILPQRLTDAALEEYGDVKAAFRDRFRLGNLGLIERSFNSEVSNKPYEAKRKVYKEVSFKTINSLTHDRQKSAPAQVALGVYLEPAVAWTPEVVQRRSESLYKMACSTFHISEAVAVQMPYEEPKMLDVPQANDPRVIIKALVALEHSSSAADVAAILTYSERQGAYYLRACEVLGLAEENESTWSLTVDGAAVVGSKDHHETLKAYLSEHAFLIFWSSLEIEARNALLTKAGLAKDTAKRRASTLNSWAHWAGLTEDGSLKI